MTVALSLHRKTNLSRSHISHHRTSLLLVTQSVQVILSQEEKKAKGTASKVEGRRGYGRYGTIGRCECFYRGYQNDAELFPIFREWVILSWYVSIKESILSSHWKEKDRKIQQSGVSSLAFATLLFVREFQVRSQAGAGRPGASKRVLSVNFQSTISSSSIDKSTERMARTSPNDGNTYLIITS